MVSVEEVVQGSLLKIELKLNGVFIDLFNIYAPNLYNDRILFFKKLNQVLEKCDPEHFILVGGDFNCTLDFNYDRNHDEPNPQSARELAGVLTKFDLVDIWRNLHNRPKQYTWIKLNNGQLSGARLDRFYTQKHHLNRIIGSSIHPTSLSDHHLITAVLCLPTAQHSKSYWHFNIKLLQDTQFKETFKLFWNNWRKEKRCFSNLRQWWDVGKIQIKIFCQQFTQNVTSELNAVASQLENEILEIERELGGQSTEGAYRSLKQRKQRLGSLLEEKVKGSLVRARFVELRDMDSPTTFFFSLEKKENKCLH